MNRKEFYNAAYIALFGGLWGVTEILLGNLLHIFEVPFKGTLMSALGCIICLTGAYLLPSKKKLPILSIGIIAICIRTFSFGIFKIHIFASMFTAALLMQIMVSLLGYNLLGFVLAGILASLSPYISSLLVFGIILGQGGLFLYHGILKDTHALSHVLQSGLAILVIIILVINIVIGILSGSLAFYFGKKLSVVEKN